MNHPKIGTEVMRVELEVPKVASLEEWRYHMAHNPTPHWYYEAVLWHAAFSAGLAAQKPENQSAPHPDPLPKVEGTASHDLRQVHQCPHCKQLFHEQDELSGFPRPALQV